MRPSKKNFSPFWPFLPYFTWQICCNSKNPIDLRNLPETRFWFLLVNNQLCSKPPSWAPPDINIMAGESCAMETFVSCYGTMMFNCLWGHGSLVCVVSELTSAVMGTCHTVTRSNDYPVTRRSVTALANQLISATGECHAWHVTRDSTAPGTGAGCSLCWGPWDHSIETFAIFLFVIRCSTQRNSHENES